MNSNASGHQFKSFPAFCIHINYVTQSHFQVPPEGGAGSKSAHIFNVFCTLYMHIPHNLLPESEVLPLLPGEPSSSEV